MTEDSNYDLAALLDALAEQAGLEYSVPPSLRQQTADVGALLNKRLAKDLLKNRDYKNFQMMQRSRKVFDTVHHAASLELLSRSGATVKESVATSFPLLTGGYDEWREKQVHGDKTDVNWWLSNKKHVQIKPEHLPTVAEIKRCSDYQHDYVDRLYGDDPEVQNLPDHLKVYPRPMCSMPPSPGEKAVLLLQGDLERPVAVEDKHLYRVKVVGLSGTDGAAHHSVTFSGKQIREYMVTTFGERRRHLRTLQKKVDKASSTARLDTDHHPDLVCGAAISCMSECVTVDTIDAGKAILGNLHLAWSSDNTSTRQLMIVGLVTAIVFSRPPRAEVEVENDVCATCLEDIAGEAWRCGTCGKTQHHDCFDGWRRMCECKGNPVTCPNCRASAK